jgi:acetyltransferase-like isoleucine patch superfamily enzyme
MPQLLYAPQSRLHKTEKEKMLCGEPFLPYTKQLIDERAQCAVAVYGFNSLTNTSIMTAHGYRERHFKQIIAAARTHQSYTDCSQRYIRGFLGSNTYITTPIHCDYGYNISIGDNVNIGPHCVFLDSAMIFIGKNTKVGARVTISTLKAPTDSKALKGSNGTEVAQEVVIGENVYISDNVSIEAGVKIGNNAIIRSGSIVVVVSALVAISELAC